MRSKTWISVAQFLECAHEKSRPHQQYQRQRYLRDDQAPAEPTSSFSRCARAMLEGHVGIFSSRTPRWSQPKQYSRQYCHRGCESQDSPIRRKIQRCRNKDRKSTRLNSSHVEISYAVFCLKKKKQVYALARA